MKKKIAVLLIAALTATLMAGCGGKKGADDGGSTKTAASGTSGVLELAITTGDGSSTDDKIPTPWYNRTMATNLMFRSLFIADDTLTSVKPDLADSYEMSEDGMKYTITLKDNLKWSDGEALTADDVVFSIETAQKAATVNSIYTAAFKNISSLSTADNVITIDMTTPYADMLNVLGQFAILPKHSLEKVDPLSIDTDAFWTAPVTSGMYALDELKVGNYFSLKQNENYEGTAPEIKKVIAYFVSDYVTAAQSGKADYVFGNGADFVEAMDDLSNYDAHKIDVLFYKYFIFNMKGIDGNENEAMQNETVRKAIIEAIDRATLATLYPNATVLNSGVPNENKAYNGFEYKYDEEQAKKDIEASGYDMSRPVRICYYNNDQTSIDLINTVVYMLENIGLKTESTLSNDGTTDLFTTRNYDIGFKGKSSFSVNEWYTEYMSTDALFANIFGGDTAFDEEIAKLTQTGDPKEQEEILTNLQNLEQEKMYKVPAFTVGTMVYTSDKVTLPDDVKFCNPLYNCDVDFAAWTVK
ncbi:ABC transporter substrate-binding protein [Hespellia stercorisuis]|uniref:Peptide/nickel transport system substrate-binding protein n=1 Tax=Hespellia stercorisuis DSM 15480 TaxID=1121950 RepID=A0A1M6K790_9FIRM|nr:ABC transporter substrate-binding protein [Hespellia stercorisuis]SHJ54804.1 peptide/nickel transport system substrate-binding protein [Hespellia stercorisuis DSM 15480]